MWGELATRRYTWQSKHTVPTLYGGQRYFRFLLGTPPV
jgi:hypothetical protein